MTYSPGPEKSYKIPRQGWVSLVIKSRTATSNTELSTHSNSSLLEQGRSPLSKNFYPVKDPDLQFINRDSTRNIIYRHFNETQSGMTPVLGQLIHSSKEKQTNSYNASC